MAHEVSPLKPAEIPSLPPVDGVRMAVAEAGIKYKGRKDVLLMVFDPGTTVAGVLTRSKCPSAPVEWCRDKLSGGEARALVVNSGNANAFTGMKGRDAVATTAKVAAEAVGCKVAEVFLASTGVIGEPLDPAPFETVLGGLAKQAKPDGFADAASAIMTTDTFPKRATARVDIDGTEVTICGIAKGAGMIAPDMATMLGFIVTDAPIAAPALQKLLKRLTRDSFNAVTVDGDTSTSDTVLLFATGKAAERGAPRIDDAKDRRLKAFRKALGSVMGELARMIARDGEGATKFVTVEVDGAKSKKSAKRIAMAIANSPLVKTAVAGEDANWGRVVMAVGKAGEPAERDRLAIWFGDIRVAVDGERDPEYSEKTVSAYMKTPEIVIRVDLGIGDGKARVWTCDLTHGYIAVNADYRS
ncbi:bifunctional glutamate N-acetyltransferase/amino-acid acetyltransferase ArgJ [Microbaculum sp. FT89]|uniref:bifunctional glutamate N-acetyltransferase/amino-acid acetyltransferase ArgJ n=1 Tax=Microbaculum sp. FT89 TaxID=3447298 RepID=UPI003F535D88